MMNRVVAAAACCLALAGCADAPSWMQFELPKAAPAATAVQFESEPAGAEAKTSTGQTCRTPCSLAVPGNEFSVAFSLTGYQTQTVPVRVQPGEGVDPNNGRPYPPRVVPNPVYVELAPAPPPPPPRRKAPPKAAKKPAAAAKTAPAPAPPPAPAAPAPAPAAAWPPPPPR